MTTPDGLTAAEEFALDLELVFDDVDWVYERIDPKERLAAIEAAAVARHVRETGCEGLREALRRHIVALGELCELVTRHEDATECGCGDFDDWFQTWDGPAQRLHVPDDVMAEALAALAPTVAACAREGCGHEERHHRVDPDDIPWCWKDCPCPGYLAPSPATEAERRGGEG